jgi:hypothetical protein
LSACESAENAGRRLAAELAAHPFSPRTRHLAVTSLRSCARLRLRGYPPLRFGAFTFGCPFALRCIIRAPIRDAWLRMEYHPSPSITVSTAPDASSRPCALRSPVALRLTPSRYSSRIPFSYCGAFAPYCRALRGYEQCLRFDPFLAQRNYAKVKGECNVSLKGLPCSFNFIAQ